MKAIDIPNGWVMLPIQPDQQMCQAAQEKLAEWPRRPARIGAVYLAMERAAPFPPARPVSVPAAEMVRDELLVSLFYAAQGDITKFRIRARQILAAEAAR
jgi:hypothetical protein